VQHVVAIVVKGYPRLSETFIAQEILSLQKSGLRYRIVSLRRPTDKKTHPVHGQITAAVDYLPEYLYEAPVRVMRAWLRVRKRPGYGAARGAFLRDLFRDLTPNRVRRFGQALVMAAELPDDVTWIYAHFLHTPASVARYCAEIRGLPWSCSAHAKDIWTSPEWEKAEKLAHMEWLVTCTRTNVDHLRGLDTETEHKVHLLYHGIDLARFPPMNRPQAPEGLPTPETPATILSVGRAVEKKGYDVLLRALADLPNGLPWRFVHVGGGVNLSALKAAARNLGLEDRVTWMGPRSQEELLALYGEADLFVLASRVAGDGDRDGLPNVLMEAQSQSLACIATRVSAIPELIVDGETGVLVEPDDASALADAMSRLIVDSEMRHRLGEAGAERVRRAFSHDASIGILAEKFGLATTRDVA